MERELVKIRILLESINTNIALRSMPFLSLKQTVKALDCSRKWLHDLTKSGKLKARYIGRKPYFLVKDICDLLTNEDSLPENY